MKRIGDLTHEELVKLTEQELLFYAKLECAEKGVPILEPVRERTKRPHFEKSVTVFVVEPYNLYFTDSKAAVEVMNLLDKHTNSRVDKVYDWNIGHEYEYVRPMVKDVFINEIKVFDVEMIKNNMDTFMKWKEDSKRFEDAIKEYDNQFAALAKEKNYVFELYYSAMDIERNIKRMREIFKEYLALSKGDRTMANSFFFKAYPNLSEEVVQKLDLDNVHLNVEQEVGGAKATV